jgi:hypothetical protein
MLRYVFFKSKYSHRKPIFEDPLSKCKLIYLNISFFPFPEKQFYFDTFYKAQHKTDEYTQTRFSSTSQSTLSVGPRFASHYLAIKLQKGATMAGAHPSPKQRQTSLSCPTHQESTIKPLKGPVRQSPFIYAPLLYRTEILYFLGAHSPFIAVHLSFAVLTGQCGKTAHTSGRKFHSDPLEWQSRLLRY